MLQTPSLNYLKYTRRLTRDDFTMVTVVVDFHRFILPEVLTHRAFSRNAGSSRAMGTNKVLDQVLLNPALPVHYGKNVKGSMSATEEIEQVEQARTLILDHAGDAEKLATALQGLGLHKQVVNRYLEPWVSQTMVITANWFQWLEFLSLRNNPGAQPEIQELALLVEAIRTEVENAPYVSDSQTWHHLPFTEDLSTAHSDEFMLGASVGRAASVSYSSDPNSKAADKAFALSQKLGGLRHWSPFEHPARFAKGWHANKLHWQDGRHIQCPPPYSNWKMGK